MRDNPYGRTFFSRLLRSASVNKSAIVTAKWLALGAVLLAPSVPVQAQQPTKLSRIGYLTIQSQSSAASGSNIDAFRRGLREFGYIEGKNIVIEYRGAGGKLDRMPELSAELVSLGVDIIVTTGMPAVLAAKHATSTIPIVTANADNLVEGGRYRESGPTRWQRHRIN